MIGAIPAVKIKTTLQLVLTLFLPAPIRNIDWC